ncbi:MAG TPA: hypothetical protein VJ596_10855 [Gemmatimonadaceae bacterium]|nr:hypothetical protein [Gemmatimonadaceae bacterium]
MRHGFPDELTRVAPATALASLVRLSPWVALNDEYSSAHLSLLQRLGAIVPVMFFQHSERQLHQVAQTLSRLHPSSRDEP